MLHTTATKIEDRWVEHFSGLLNQPTLVDDKVLDDFQQLPIQHELSNPPMLREVQAAIKRTKSGCTPGLDGTPPEIIIHGGHALGKKLHSIFTKIWETEQIPTNFIDANITILFKKGDPHLCGNHRGISIMSVVGKVLADLMLQHLCHLL